MKKAHLRRCARPPRYDVPSKYAYARRFLARLAYGTFLTGLNIECFNSLDFSDIPESTDEELRRARRVGRPKSGRPPRQLIAIRIDPLLLKKLRTQAAKQRKPYQTLIHELLERAAKKAA